LRRGHRRCCASVARTRLSSHVDTTSLMQQCRSSSCVAQQPPPMPHEADSAGSMSCVCACVV
jgi:hypothetical protein